MLCIGFTLGYGSMFSKIWTLYRLTTRSRKDLQVIIVIIILCLLSKLSCETFAFSALTLLVGRQEGHPACKKTEWWGAGVVFCLERGADCIWPS